MSNDERILELKACADRLNIRIHLASMSFESRLLQPMEARDVFGIVFINHRVSNNDAFFIQQHRYDHDERVE